MKILTEHLQKVFDLTNDLAKDLSADDLILKLKDLPSNTIGEQFWCVVGARESYLKAINRECWMGFNCSLDNTTSKIDLLHFLEKSAEENIGFLNSHKLSEIQAEFIISLIEHETQHHGQLIRYVYGNKLDFPKSWSDRYNV